MDTSALSPIQNYLLIDQDEETRQTETGLYLPGDNRGDCATGTVLSVGPGGRNEEMVVEEEDRVLYLEATGREIPSTDQALRLVRQTNIFGTIDAPEGANTISTI